MMVFAIKVYRAAALKNYELPDHFSASLIWLSWLFESELMPWTWKSSMVYEKDFTECVAK